MASVKKDYYEILGVARDATPDEIKRAYRQSALKYHPDRNQGNPEAEEMFKECSEAYDVLSDAEKRRIFDSYGYDGLHRGGYGGFSDVSDIFRHFSGMGGFEDLFSELFNIGKRRNGSGSSPAERGSDLRYRLEVDFLTAYNGGEEEITVKASRTCSDCDGWGAKFTDRHTCSVCGGRGEAYQSMGFFSVATACPRCRGLGYEISKPCQTCRGSGLVKKNETITVTIPAGIGDGMRIRLAGLGEGGLRGGPTGDLYVEVKVRSHEAYKREGDDLLIDLPISITEAVLGGNRKLKLPDGITEVDVKFGSGTQPGQLHYLRGKGFSRLGRGFGHGDAVVRLMVEIPKHLNRKQKELLEKLREEGI